VFEMLFGGLNDILKTVEVLRGKGIYRGVCMDAEKDDYSNKGKGINSCRMNGNIIFEKKIRKRMSILLNSFSHRT